MNVFQFFGCHFGHHGWRFKLLLRRPAIISGFHGNLLVRKRLEVSLSYDQYLESSKNWENVPCCGMTMFEFLQAINKRCRTRSGFTGIRDVNSVLSDPDDIQQSYFMAETLKYLYLTFLDDDILPLDTWVFNTEAHPLPVIGTYAGFRCSLPLHNPYLSMTRKLIWSVMRTSFSSYGILQ